MIPIIYSDEYLQHRTGAFHPERPERLTAAVAALKQATWADRLDWREPTSLDRRSPLAAIAAVHTQSHIEKVKQLAAQGGGRLDPDTWVSTQSYTVALLAVNGWLDGVNSTLATGEPTFVLARPPGHHALADRGMGFCLFSNAAIAAHYALQQPGIGRVAILDWDVHHGNGTQAIVESHPHIAYCSLHEYPHYPGTGSAEERGNGNVLNIPMASGSSIREYERAFVNQVMPFLQETQPDLLLVSAGYDGNQADPLASIALQPEHFGIFTDYCLSLTRHIVFGLEGGYDLDTLGRSVVATVERCLSQSPGQNFK
ncbi:MAG: histone deacetylase [Coleofasciculaceae cyanobacterium SM2_3_26]|nr:histone deacetylase [Coleofasciculaceae cyanobacterium SM2_3_26]